MALRAFPPRGNNSHVGTARPCSCVLHAGLADHLHFNSEWRLVDFILDKASILNDPLLRRIGLAAFAYAAIGILEGIGLYLEKAWGEYLTLVITASFLPWEIFEVLRRVTWFRFSLLTANVLVFLYLLRLVLHRKRCKEMLPTVED